jgi:xylan 1,4-beta-xylosidase
VPPVPLLPGFHPDPSIVRCSGSYYLVSSTFEYLPGLPVHRSDDLEHWELIGHVATREEQLGVRDVFTLGGAWAPTIRQHDGAFHVIVTVMGGRGTVVFTAADPSGPWSDGTPIEIAGIDPDLAWDDDGTCHVTYSGLQLGGRHLGIQQVRVDLATGQVLDEPRSLWSGTGLIFPEAPHLYRIGDRWYLLIAEGGTERGHAVSIARSTSPTGPFEGCPDNPLLTASGTDRPVQCTGHADLVETADGRWLAVLLGVWVRGSTRAFGSLGRETFATDVTWVDGWPSLAPVDARARTPLPPFVDHFDTDRLGPDWIAVRTPPDAVADLLGQLTLHGTGATMDDRIPTFLGRRQTRLDARIAATVRRDADTVGGLTLRFDEQHHYDLELQPRRAVARAVLPTIRDEHTIDLVDDAVELALELRPPTRGAQRGTSDLVDVVVTSGSGRQVIATFDGRYLSTESATSFTGRVAGLYCQTGRLRIQRYEETDL